MTLEEALREAEALSWTEGGTTRVVKLRKVKELLRKVFDETKPAETERKRDEVNLKIDPERVKEGFGETGIFVRAQDENGKYKTVDIVDLDAESLLIWLRSRGGDNSWAEDVVGILLGHGHLHKDG